ncbi:hypothetical protein MKC54_10500 [[Clostridium] innocuum]|nr:hypothetical protein [[Clostridium] innocuum]MCR0577315.1 hypothetical protein [[Clostridium] innocuum]
MKQKDKSLGSIVAYRTNGTLYKQDNFQSNDEYLRLLDNISKLYQLTKSEITGFQIYIKDRMLLEIGICNNA